MRTNTYAATLAFDAKPKKGHACWMLAVRDGDMIRVTRIETDGGSLSALAAANDEVPDLAWEPAGDNWVATA